MVEKAEIIDVMKQLNQALNQAHTNSLTAQFVNESLVELQNSEGVAFTGAMQYFLNKAPVVKLSDGIKLNETEKKLWHQALSFNELGNNLWGANI
ncbi:hypothetical protein CPR19088_GLDEOEPO_02440 [Companilactobacillus paralimentarius]